MEAKLLAASSQNEVLSQLVERYQRDSQQLLGRLVMQSNQQQMQQQVQQHLQQLQHPMQPLPGQSRAHEYGQQENVATPPQSPPCPAPPTPPRLLLQEANDAPRREQQGESSRLMLALEQLDHRMATVEARVKEHSTLANKQVRCVPFPARCS